MEKNTGKVMTTDEYNKFRRLPGNRSVTEMRVKKILKSIQQNGYIGCPIVVNEKMQVIDGQGRLESCKRLNVAIPYTVVPGTGLEECMALNRYSTSWGLKDYIELHVEEGKESYIYLLNLIKAYQGKGIGLNTITFASAGIIGCHESIKNGTFACNQEHYEEACRMLDYVVMVAHLFRKAGGKKDCYFIAIVFAWQDPNVDNITLMKQLEKYQIDIVGAHTVESALKVVEDIYNTRTKKKAYIVTDYKKAMNDKYSWYGKKYGLE